MIYQAGEPDQFMHRYQYDSDNRITEVETSKDGKIWENDASYFYYSHGPLARTEIGDKKVQGIDYAYTIQGWIKGVNSEELAPAFDMGLDGGTAGTLAHRQNSQVAQDAFGYSLSYFEGDYAARISGADNFLRYSKNLPSSSANLYNGNIRDMYTAIMKDDETPLGTYNYQYQYDQLNRIKAMNSQGLSLSGSTIVPVAGLYETSYSYDRNGNITSLQRWADNGTTKTAMDEFSYDYIAGTNKLALVHDAVSAGNFADDLDDQVAGLAGLSFPTYDLQNETTHNYRYDAIGQLVQDKTEEIDTIIWTVTGKVKKIQRFAFSEKPDLEFEYNPMGQRIMKIVYPKSAPGVIDTDGIEKMYYIRDAQGNVMAIYTLKTEDSEKNLYLTERNLYGSSMLGIEKIGEVIASTEPTNVDINTEQQRVVGDKRFYMQNHLNSVMVTLTDRKLPEYNATENLAYYKPDVVSYSDFLPFGKLSPNRHGGDMGRIGFQGQEQVSELKGVGRDIHFTYRDYDPDIGRMKSIDPLADDYPWNSPYAFSENRVIDGLELEGLEYYPAGKAPITFASVFGSDDTKLKIVHYDRLENDLMKNTLHNLNIKYFGEERASRKQLHDLDANFIIANYKNSDFKENPLSLPGKPIKGSYGAANAIKNAPGGSEGSRNPSISRPVGGAVGLIVVIQEFLGVYNRNQLAKGIQEMNEHLKKVKEVGEIVDNAYIKGLIPDKLKNSYMEEVGQKYDLQNYVLEGTLPDAKYYDKDYIKMIEEVGSMIYENREVLKTDN